MTSRTRRPRSIWARRRWRRRDGTTFLELLLVVTILAVAAAAVLPRLSGSVSGYQWQEATRRVETLLFQAERQARLCGRSLHIVWEEKAHRLRLQVDSGAQGSTVRGSTPWGEPTVSTDELRAFVLLKGNESELGGGPGLETSGSPTVLSVVKLDPKIRVKVEGFPVAVSTTGEMSEGFLSLTSGGGESFSIRIPEDIVSPREFAR